MTHRRRIGSRRSSDTGSCVSVRPGLSGKTPPLYRTRRPRQDSAHGVREPRGDVFDLGVAVGSVTALRAGSTRSRTENLPKLEPHVSRAVVIVRWAKAHGIDDASPEALAASPAVRPLIESEVAQVNRGLGSFEQFKCFRTFPRDLTVETGELSPTLKVKRKVATERYRREIEEMYA